MSDTRQNVPLPSMSDNVRTGVMTFKDARRLIEALRDIAPSDPATHLFIEIERFERANHPYPAMGAFYVPSALTTRLAQIVAAAS